MDCSVCKDALHVACRVQSGTPKGSAVIEHAGVWIVYISPDSRFESGREQTDLRQRLAETLSSRAFSRSKSLILGQGR